jgi:hypothetical protein
MPSAVVVALEEGVDMARELAANAASDVQRRLEQEAGSNARAAENIRELLAVLTKFYDWLISKTGVRIPEGPPVWICGDCHLGNLGPVANVKGQVEIAIRDLDQTVIGNPAHDLMRLARSLATAARGSDLPGVTTALALEQMILGYDEALAHPARAYRDFPRMPKPLRRILKPAMKREWRHLAEERIEDVKPRIPLGECFWSVSRKEKDEIERLFQTKEARQLVTALHGRDEDAKIQCRGCSLLDEGMQFLRPTALCGAPESWERWLS